MRQCLFPWNFNQFFSLVVFTYLTFDFGSIYLQWMKSYVELALLYCLVLP